MKTLFEVTLSHDKPFLTFTKIFIQAKNLAGAVSIIEVLLEEHGNDHKIESIRTLAKEKSEIVELTEGLLIT